MKFTTFLSLLSKLKQNNLAGEFAHSLLAPPYRMGQLKSLNVSNVKTLIETIDTITNNPIEDVIRDYKGNQQLIIDNLAKLPLTDLKKDKNNPYYIKLAIQRKEELAANEKKTYVPPQKILQALKSISKNSNPRYREKVSYNKRNNLDYKGNPIAKDKNKV